MAINLAEHENVKTAVSAGPLPSLGQEGLEAGASVSNVI